MLSKHGDANFINKYFKTYQSDVLKLIYDESQLRF